MLYTAPNFTTKPHHQQVHTKPHHRLQLCSHSSNRRSSRSTTAVNSMPACLVLLPATLSDSELLPLLQAAHNQHCSRVYVSIQGMIWSLG
jgi:hypothetical protein